MSPYPTFPVFIPLRLKHGAVWENVNEGKLRGYYFFVCYRLDRAFTDPSYDAIIKSYGARIASSAARLINVPDTDVEIQKMLDWLNAEDWKKVNNLPFFLCFDDRDRDLVSICTFGSLPRSSDTVPDL